jgi:hypothetical protein
MIDNAMNTLIRVRSSRKKIVYNCGAPYLTYRIVVVNYWFKDPMSRLEPVPAVRK